jgi:hypothetical protein
MKDIITKILWKIQQIAMTKMPELFLCIVVAGTINIFLTNYLISHHIANNNYILISFTLFIYYSCYKIIIDRE